MALLDLQIFRDLIEPSSNKLAEAAASRLISSPPHSDRYVNWSFHTFLHFFTLFYTFSTKFLIFSNLINFFSTFTLT